MTHHRSGHWTNAPTQSAAVNLAISALCLLAMLLLALWAWGEL